jgi:glycosyltransferase involved in cell wall biosynthesis
MRVLHISAGNLYGGVETMLVSLARYRHLCPEMEPEFALCFEGRLSQELVFEGAPAHMLGEVRIRQAISVWRARKYLKELLLHRHFDAVVCHTAWPQVVFGPVIRSMGIPLVLWMHSITDGRHWLDRWAHRTKPDLVLCNSDFTATAVRNSYLGIPVKTIYCPVGRSLPYGEGTRQAARAEFDTPIDDVVIVQVSRLEEWKGHRTLIDALGLLHELPNWTCWIIGGAQRAQEARYLEQLKLATSRLGVSAHIRFGGQRSDIQRLLAAADVFCQPNSEPEPFGIVFIEALYRGLPVITSATGGALEIVDESCAMLVPSMNPNALAKALKKLIVDAAVRETLGYAGPARATELCDPARQIARMRDIFGAAFGLKVRAESQCPAWANSESPQGLNSQEPKPILRGI